MLKIYNTKAITRQQRFTNAVVVGVAAAVAVTVLYVLITRMTNVYIPALLAVGGYAIGMAIQKFGRGVQAHFSWLGGGLALVMVIVADFLTIPGGCSVNRRMRQQMPQNCWRDSGVKRSRLYIFSIILNCYREFIIL